MCAFRSVVDQLKSEKHLTPVFSFTVSPVSVERGSFSLGKSRELSLHQVNPFCFRNGWNFTSFSVQNCFLFFFFFFFFFLLLSLGVRLEVGMWGGLRGLGEKRIRRPPSLLLLSYVTLVISVFVVLYVPWCCCCFLLLFFYKFLFVLFWFSFCCCCLFVFAFVILLIILL